MLCKIHAYQIVFVLTGSGFRFTNASDEKTKSPRSGFSIVRSSLGRQEVIPSTCMKSKLVVSNCLHHGTRPSEDVTAS